jgi:hypothetical protein
VFDVTLDVDVERINWFLKELNNNQFITVHTLNITPVDSAAQAAKGYFYGPRPVAQLNLQCEIIFFHKWCMPLMPKEVASNLAGEGGSGPAGGGAPGGAPFVPGRGRGPEDVMY